MKRLACIIGTALLVTCGSSTSIPARTQASFINADLDGDGTTEHIELNGKLDPALKIRSRNRITWQGVHRRWKPWKLAIADVDGDGRREIVVSVFKATRYFPKPHNCLFVYGWSATRAYPKWLGSTLSKPFIDFAFTNLDEDREDELVAIETRRDGKLCLVFYSWNGFGFTLERQLGAWNQARFIANTGDHVVVEADGKRSTINGIYQ